jgi:hypothetical protein
MRVWASAAIAQKTNIRLPANQYRDRLKKREQTIEAFIEFYRH